MQREPEDDATAIRRLAGARLKVATLLTTSVIVAYFGFILLVAFGKQTMGTALHPGLSLGLLLGALLILFSWLLTWIYAAWANTRFDRMVGVVLARETPR